MIPQTIPTCQTPDWKDELRDAVTSVPDLLALLNLSPADFPGGLVIDSNFPLRVPLSFVRRMRRSDPHDPLLLQVLPLAAEEVAHSGFVADPLAERQYNPVPGVIHKYRGRALLVTTPVCAVNCRYCFRRHFPYADNTPGKRQWRQSLTYIAESPEISEVILSGGDPLATDDQHLAWLAAEITAIPHVRRLRIHSRLPVVIPNRVDDRLMHWLAKLPLDVAFVLHINHPQEIDNALRAAAAQLREAGILVLNQSVLLKGINDDDSVLVQLSEELFSAGILPYYLHLLDPVAGAAHFDISEQTARTLYTGMRERLPGYLLPRLVRDIPGEASKMPITPQY